MTGIYAECPECGRLYDVREGLDCESATSIPPQQTVRIVVQDNAGDDADVLLSE